MGPAPPRGPGRDPSKKVWNPWKTPSTPRAAPQLSLTLNGVADVKAALGRIAERRVKSADLSCRDRDALHLALRLRPLGDADGQDAVLECGVHPIGIDIGPELHRALEASVPAFAVDGTLALGFFLASQGEDTVMQRDLDVLLFEPGNFGDHLHIVVGLGDLGMRPAARPTAGQHRQVEAAGKIIED